MRYLPIDFYRRERGVAILAEVPPLEDVGARFRHRGFDKSLVVEVHLLVVAALQLLVLVEGVVEVVLVGGDLGVGVLLILPLLPQLRRLKIINTVTVMHRVPIQAPLDIVVGLRVDGVPIIDI